jgi:transcriptional repressor NrdR
MHQEIDYSNCSRALRLKECIDCGKRFTTYEYVEAVELMVRRKDCRLEHFDLNKVIRGLQKELA